MAQASDGGGCRLPLPILPDHVSLHVVGDRGLLLDAWRQRLYAASPAATLLWCCLAESMPRSEILSLFGQRAGLSPEDASRCLDDAVENWRDTGLLDRTPASGPPRHSVAVAPLPAAPDSPAAPAPGPAYRLLDTVFVVAVSDAALMAAVEPVIGHLRTTDRVPGPERLMLAVDGAGITVCHEGVGSTRCAGPDEVGPLVLAVMSHAAVRRCPALCAVHAGAVDLDDGCALFVGPAGRGKSTLVAALAAAGLRALCDDTVLLADTLKARPLGGTICVKEGSWPVLADAFPALSALPVHRRPDGRTVRYLAGTSIGQEADGRGREVRRIVFPRYDPGAVDASLVRVDAATALTRFTACLYLLDRRLDAALVERLVRWIEGIPCAALRYASLNDAVGLFAEPGP